MKKARFIGIWSLTALAIITSVQGMRFIQCTNEFKAALFSKNKGVCYRCSDGFIYDSKTESLQMRIAIFPFSRIMSYSKSKQLKLGDTKYFQAVKWR